LDVCGWKTYSFAIFGGMVALRELRKCMALSVGVALLNLSADDSTMFADARNINAKV
jgi:hypothetical protein